MNTSQKTRFTTAKRHLAAGILAQARKDLRRFNGATQPVERELYFDAYDWVVSDSCLSPFSFRNVCAMLHLSAESIRQEVFRDVSLGAFQYWSHRFGTALRQVHLSLREGIIGERRRVSAEIGTLVHGLS
jgi:hypothetical protein